ncbi:hypothetical protein B5723_03205 [Mammaliicoccus sciuri]|uniref:hypothetical protein n=1 Tax=Mammaliicoccus sciuri TaxID=1296 RepID=UPI000A002F25|nr:hypothetical protein [Mammaliicoccus sciuri]ORI05534.1 hypothetical protein B5723_03205 [Mammaliicoccus sciuri]
MSVEIKGVRELVNQLEKKYGIENSKKVNDKALKKAGAYFEKELSSAFKTFEDTGASRKEINLSEPKYLNGVRGIQVYWQGPMDRYRLIHLNEWGYTRDGKEYTPKGHAVIAKALKKSEKIYRNIIKDEIRKNMI